jgi:chemotaxis signal transduction protein
MIQLTSPHVPDPGKYLTFALHNEYYSVPVLKVREIMRLCPITPVPRMPAFIQGVINLRGKIVPVIDLRKRSTQNGPAWSLCNLTLQKAKHS